MRLEVNVVLEKSI